MDGAGPVAAPALIGPNAILQLLPVIERAGGRALRARLLAAAGIAEVPSGAEMIDEAPAARLHQALRREVPDLAPALAAEAGRRTGDYILANRIPPGARAVLRLLPARFGAPILARAVARHAWTFAGSGGFRLVSTTPPVFEIADNPVVRGEVSDTPLCHWHAAVFARLFAALVHRDATCRETACCARGDPACRFEVSWRA